MHSNFTSHNQHDSQRCLYPSFKYLDTEDGQPFPGIDRSNASLQSSSVSGSPCANKAELGETEVSFSPAGRENLAVSGTENHDVPDKVHRMPINLPSFSDFFQLGLDKRHPFVFILFQSLKAALWLFGPLGWLKVISPSFSMSKGSTIAGVLVGIVFLKDITAYLLWEFVYISGYKPILDWLQLRPRWRQFLSFSRSPFNLGEQPEADEVEFTIRCRSRQEIYAALIGEGWVRRLFEFLTYPFGGFRDLHSLPVIAFRTFQVWGCILIVHALGLYLAPEWNQDFRRFAGVIAGATFLKQVLAYLRPEHPLIWVCVVQIIDLLMIANAARFETMREILRALEYSCYNWGGSDLRVVLVFS